MTVSTPSYPTAYREELPANELMIMGNGFFIVRNPSNSDYYATQASSFMVDDEGYLVTEMGARLQGCLDIGLTRVGDLQVNAGNLPPMSEVEYGLLYYAIDEMGRLMAHLTDGTSFVCGQIMLQNFEDPRALISEGSQLFSNLVEAGPLPTLMLPGTNGLGTIHTGMLEFSRAAGPGWRN